ncbi:hypothetical protein CAPTEDRAFT_215677 [Capitella teleta]|uniref:BTB domain-containing protein n=1 Tax=Capitella teleta TaxID=283909 RepID=R7TTM3_CAPTE|nr:hypothetical protein CAPTEDRAFT_215677 [Capitella teleta]|eukprot:ELT97034.1 hypothetical protein CAPTEDRAFT_215677 [Capitella teleta]
MTAAFQKMKEAEEMVDVELVFEETRVKCHRIMLAASSEYFLRLLQTDMQARDVKEITIKEVSSSTGRLLVDCLYSANTSLSHLDCHPEALVYADDTMLYRTGKDPAHICPAIEEDLRIAAKWADIWGMRFNASKTVAMYIYQTTATPPPITFAGATLEYSHEHRHFGFILDSALSFHDHKSVSCLLGVLHRGDSFLVVRGQDSLLDQFSIIPEKFIETSLSPHVGVGSRLECAMLCQRDKCCYSALTKNDDYNVQCQMLNYVFPEEDLSDDEGGAYLIRIHEPDSQQWLVHYDAAIFGNNLFSINEITEEMCKAACVERVDCLSIDFYTETGNCFLNYYTSKTVPLSEETGTIYMEKTCGL